MSESSASEKFVKPDVADWRSSLFEVQQAALVSYVTHLLGDLEAARDVVQDAFLRLCDADPDQVRDHAVPWLFTVCRRRALDQLRKERRMQALDDAGVENLTAGEPSPDVAAGTNDDAERAGRFLKRLPPNQREVVVLKFENGLSYREISELTGLSITNIGFLIHTALRQLRRQLAGESLVVAELRRMS